MLYSREFYAAAKMRLRPDGILQQWYPGGADRETTAAIARSLKEIRTLKQLTIIVSEQVLSFTMEIADRLVVIEKGRFVHENRRDELDIAKVSSYLSV